MDLEDLKDGKLDRIEERQVKDPEAKSNSVIIIIKEKEVIREVPNHWYWPYSITIQNPIWYTSPSIPNYTYCNSLSTTSANTLNYNGTTYTGNAVSINCSIAKDYSAGTYDIGNKIVNFR